ncbi:MAG: polyprenyl synthetase family protein [Candidatus Hodarchaeaceae archaeon]|nr:polyprenyl synthetase family protein [Candidatus Hodarchaeaceae archaeon]
MELMKYLQGMTRKVEKEIDEWFPRDAEPEVLARASRHLLEAGGKRLRPCLALLSCEAVGGRVEDAMEAAAALELLHNFTLIHDDIMDRDEFRRNVKTVHTIWGEPVAIIAGDALFAKVFEAVAANAKRLDLPSDRVVELFETVSRASFEICQGQALDMLFGGRDDVSETEYLKMVSSKTGALMEASARVGALLGNGKPRQVKALAEYGRLVGIAFQIQDDMLGIVGEREKFGKPIGNDIREGKRTLMVVRALEAAAPKDRAILLRSLGNKRASEAEIVAAIEVLKRTGTIGYAADKARELVASAKSKLKALSDSRARRLLLELADFTIKREF